MPSIVVDDVTLRLSLSDTVSSDDVRVVVSSTHVTVSRRSTDEQIFKGTWQHRIDPDTATWNVGEPIRNAQLYSIHV